MIPITGDILEPSLGLSKEDVKTVTENVSIVFHSAATVRFDEPIERHINLDIVNKSVRPFLFTISNVIYTISNVIYLVKLQNGSWVLFTISRNSLYRGSLYQALSVHDLALD